MIKTDPTMLVCNATPGPWMVSSSDRKHGARRTDALCVRGTHHGHGISSVLAEIEVNRPMVRGESESNARLMAAAPPLLKVAQKLLLWMEECMAACDFNRDDIDLYHELRQTIRTAGGFSSDTHWWQGPCICDACGHAWQGVVEIPIESTYPQVPLECSECHQMTGGPA